MKQAVYFDEYEDGDSQDVLICYLCPKHCVIPPNGVGFCKVRKNMRGMLYSLNYGQITSINMDPIEKKPLYHYAPGSKILSVGSWGCNLSCSFCQNYTTAHEKPKYVQRVDPDQLVEIAFSEESEGIAFTYNEPIVSFEFLLDTSRAASKEGLFNVMVTNGFIDEEPFKLLTQSIKAMNIDLKFWNRDYYEEIGGERNAVLKTIQKAHESDLHVELTTLLIPGKSDGIDDITEEVKWISELSDEIPLHLSRYFPAYKSDIPPTDEDVMIKLYDKAKEYLKYVYLGNIDFEGYNDTVCPDCNTPVISRRGYNIEIKELDEFGRCKHCGKQIVRM